MASGQNTAEGLTDGTVPTTGNTGGSSGTAINAISVASGDTIVARNAAAAHQAVGYRMTWAATGAGATRLLFPMVESTRTVFSFYVRIDVLPTAVEDLGGIRYASGNMGILTIGADGKAVMYTSAGTAIAASKATNTFPVAQWVRVDMSALKGTSGTTGTLGYAYFTSESDTADFSWELTTTNAGTANSATGFIGRSTGRAEAHTIDFDTIRWAATSSGFFTHYVSPAVDYPSAGAGSAATTGAGSAPATRSAAGSGSSASSGAVVDVLAHDSAAAGSATATAAGIAASSTDRPCAGAGNATTTATSAAVLARDAAGAGSASSAATGAATGDRASSGTGSATATGTGIAVRAGIAAGIGLATTAATGATVAGQIRTLTGTGSAATTATGASASRRISTGAGSAVSSATAAGNASKVATGTGSASTTAAPIITTRGFRSTAAGNAVTAGSGALIRVKILIGAGTGVTTASAVSSPAKHPRDVTYTVTAGRPSEPTVTATVARRVRVTANTNQR